MKKYYSKRGRYNPHTAECNKEAWTHRNAYVYIIQCHSTDFAEIFYKIGITTFSVEERFYSGMPYKYKKMQLIKTSLYDAIYIEEQLHKEVEEYRYAPAIKFSGWTESFTKPAYL